jgi:hypothetical protein
MVKVRSGGKKKKLYMSVAAIEEIAASRKPHVLATINMYNKYANPTVVAFTDIRP